MSILVFSNYGQAHLLASCSDWAQPCYSAVGAAHQIRQTLGPCFHFWKWCYYSLLFFQFVSVWPLLFHHHDFGFDFACKLCWISAWLCWYLSLFPGRWSFQNFENSIEYLSQNAARIFRNCLNWCGWSNSIFSYCSRQIHDHWQLSKYKAIPIPFQMFSAMRPPYPARSSARFCCRCFVLTHRFLHLICPRPNVISKPNLFSDLLVSISLLEATPQMCSAIGTYGNLMIFVC